MSIEAVIHTVWMPVNVHGASAGRSDIQVASPPAASEVVPRTPQSAYITRVVASGRARNAFLALGRDASLTCYHHHSVFVVGLLSTPTPNKRWRMRGAPRSRVGRRERGSRPHTSCQVRRDATRIPHHASDTPGKSQLTAAFSNESGAMRLVMKTRKAS